MQSVLWGLREQFLRLELVNDCMRLWMRLSARRITLDVSVILAHERDD